MSSQNLDAGRPVTTRALMGMKNAAERIVMLTAYDASFAALMDAAGVDMVLVGDSLGMVVQGLDTTVPVTVDDMIYHSRCVARGLNRAMLVVDMPFMSYATREEAAHTAARLMQEGGAQMVKLEGGALQVDSVRYLAERGIPICAHLGLTPQSVHKLGGYRVQGRDQKVAEKMISDAHALEQAGADVLLLECVPNSLAKAIREQLKVPVIGIGAGPHCDGQVLVIYDILGISPGRQPRFVKNYMAEASDIRQAVERYVRDVREGVFPGPEHCFA